MKIKLKSKTMPEEFEKNIKRKMQEFNLEPSPQVWNEIDAALGEKKRRRFVIWWWLLPVMLAAGGVWLFLGSQQSAISSQKEEKKKQSAISSQKTAEKIEDRRQELEGKKQPAISIESERKDKQLVIVPKKGGNINSTETKADKKIVQDVRKEHFKAKAKIKQQQQDVENQKEEKQEVFLKKELSATKEKISKTGNLNGDQSKTKIPAESIITEGSSAKATNPVEPVINEKGDTVNTLIAENKTTEIDIVKKDSVMQQQPVVQKLSAAAVEKTKQNKQIIKRGNWLFNIGGGVTSNKETSSKKLLTYESPLSYQSDVTNPGNANGNGNNNNSQSADSTAKIFNPGEGYHFFAGISYDYTLSKSWKINAGLQYRFLSNTQKAGKNIHSTIYLGQYSGSLAFSSVPSYYNAGYAYTITNKTNWLEVPVNIEYTVNPSGKTKIFLSVGASYAWMFSSKWIIPDSRSNRLYYHDDFLNNHIFNWQAGAGFTIPAGFKFGLQYQQSTTFVAKFIEPHLRWQNISVYTGIPLFKNKRTNK